MKKKTFLRVCPLSANGGGELKALADMSAKNLNLFCLSHTLPDERIV